MRIVPPIRPIRDGKILDVNLINHIINRTEYGAELLSRYKMVAGSNIFVEQAGNGLGVSYLTALAGGAGTGSGGAGTGSGGAGTGTGGAGTGTGGAGTPQPVAFPYRIVGDYVVSGVTRGFVYNGLTFTDIFFPGSIETQPTGIDGSNIVGQYVVNNVRRSFIYDGSKYTDISVNTAFNIAWNIKGSGISGSYLALPSGGLRGYFYNGSTYTDIVVPGSPNTVVYGFDGSNFVGTFGSNIPGSGFLYNGSTFTTLLVPNSQRTTCFGIYGSKIVGAYARSGLSNAFSYDGSTFTDIIFPGSTRTTSAYGINGSNIVGSHFLSGLDRGYIYDGSTFTDIFVPGSTSTIAYGIG